MHKRWSIVATASALLAATVFIAAQNAPQRAPEPAGTGSISGTVLVMGTSTPIAGARVEARRANCNSTAAPESTNAVTDANGRYVLEKLRAGSWCVGAAHPSGQYTPAEYQQRGPLGRGLTLSLSDAQKLDGIGIALAP